MLVLSWGTWDKWGIQFDYCPSEQAVTLCIIHWWIALEWSK